MKRFTLAGLLLASGSLIVACSDNPVTQTPTGDSGTDTPATMDVVDDNTQPPIDAPVTETSTGDASGDASRDGAADARTDARTDAVVDAGMTCRGLMWTDLTRAASGTTTVTGDTTTAFMMQMARATPPIPAVRNVDPNTQQPCVGSVGQVVYRYTTGASPSIVRVSSTNMGTPRTFDTVVMILSACGTAGTPTGLACNDDDQRYEGSTDRRTTSFATTATLMPNTTIYIVMGGFPMEQTPGNNRGMFELSVEEIVPVAMGGACRTDGVTMICGAGLQCVGATPIADTGTCQPPGTVPGSICRTGTGMAPCDAPLTCTTAVGATVGFCTQSVAMGAACDLRVNPAVRICPTSATCVNPTLGATTGVCAPTGSTAGFACRPAGAPGGLCDAGLTCDADTNTCRVAAATGAACNLATSLCATGTTCVRTYPTANVGTCRPDGTAAGTRCRAGATGAPGRCDAMLTCQTIGTGETARDYCVTVADPGTQCVFSQFRVCAMDLPCFYTDLTVRGSGRCASDGTSGGQCNVTAPFCNTGLTCSVMAPSDTNRGVCQTTGMEGAPCQRPTSACATGFTCVLNAGSDLMGTCRADGAVAGADCRTGSDTRCAAPLTCSGAATGTCQSAAASAAACDPLFTSTVCATGTVCRPTSYRAGTCGAATGMETEPNNSPMTAGAPITAPVTLTASLGRGDVDCVAVTVAANGGVLAQVSDGNGSCPPFNNGGITLDLYASNGTTVIGTSELSGPGTCSTIDGNRRGVYDWASGLTAGTYYVCARGYVNAQGRGTPTVDRYYFSAAPLPARTP